MNAAISLPPDEGRTILHHRRHAQQKQSKTLGHLGPAVVLVLGVAPVLAGTERLTLLLALEVAVGAAYLGLMVRELRHLRHRPFHAEPVAWLELAAAGILALESYHIWHQHHAAELAGAPHRLHLLPGLYAAAALLYVGMAFRLKRLEARCFLHLHPAGFAVRTRRLGRARHLRWAEIGAVEPAGPADLLVHHVDGRIRRITFADVHDGPARRDELLAHCRRARPAGPPAGADIPNLRGNFGR